MSNLRLYLHSKLITFVWWCEYVLDNLPHPRQRKHLFFEPFSATAFFVSLAVSAASFGAQLIITKLLAPKPKPRVEGKLTGQLQITDSIWGAPIVQVLGGAPGFGDNVGGIEIGGNVFFASNIRVIQTQVPGNSGGHQGKGGGGGSSSSTIQLNYKIDVAVGVGEGPLRLLRMKFNEDVVFGGTPSGGGTTNSYRYEAESPDNTIGGGAVIAADPDCSDDQKVVGIGNGGTLTFNFEDALELAPPPDPEDIPPFEPHPFYFLKIYYKSDGDSQAYVKLNGTGGVYIFPDTGGQVGEKLITRRYSALMNTLEFSNPSGNGPEIDCLDVSIEDLYEANARISGARDMNFPAEAAQDNILLPDPYDIDTNAFERYNGRIPESVDSVMEVTLPNGASLAWYEGTEDQPIDAVIAAVLGAGSTPAFKGTAFARIQNLDFTKWGAFPQIRFLVENIQTKTVAEICTVLALRSGLEESDLDFSVAEDLNVRGYVISGIEPAAKTFEELALIYNLSFVENTDGQIKAIDLSNRTVAAQIFRKDLGAYVAEEEDKPPVDSVLSTLVDESTTLVQRMELQHFNPAMPADFGTDRADYTYPYTNSNRTETRSVNALLTKSEAERIIRREVQKNHLKAIPDAISIPHSFAGLDSGEVVEVEIEGEMRKRRIEEKSGSAPGIYECSLSNEDVFVLADDETLDTANPKREISAQVYFPANTVGTVMDIPPLQEAQEGFAGVYVSGCPISSSGGAWSSCGVYRSKGAGYQRVKVITKAAVMGRVVGTFGDVSAGLGTTERDTVNSVIVDFFGTQEPTTVTSFQATDGANSYLIGSEVCIVETWTRDNDYPNRWIGTDIIRQLKNTKDFSAAHVDGERVVFLSDAVVFVPLELDELGVARTWKFVTAGASIDDAAPIDFTWSGQNLLQGKNVSVAEDRTLTPADSGKVLTNAEATALLTLTLPAPSGEMAFTVAVVSAVGIRLNAPTGERIYFGQQQSATSGYVESLVAVSVLTIREMDGKWVVSSSNGKWSVS